MAKEPWQEDIYDQEESRAGRRHRNHGGLIGWLIVF